DPWLLRTAFGLGRRLRAIADFHGTCLPKAKKAITPWGDGLWFPLCSVLVWLHHPVAVGRLRPTLIRSRPSSSSDSDTSTRAVNQKRPEEVTDMCGIQLITVGPERAPRGARPVPDLSHRSRRPSL